MVCKAPIGRVNWQTRLACRALEHDISEFLLDVERLTGEKMSNDT